MNLKRRVKDLDKRCLKRGIYSKVSQPDEIWLVGIDRNEKGELVEVSRSLHWKLNSKSVSHDATEDL